MIAGTAKGHKLKTPKGDSTRPTSDKVKGSLFNIIAPYIEDTVVLDLFAGTGNLGIEALSRGAKKAVFVDKSQECAMIIKGNLEHTKLSDKAEVISGTVTDVLNKLAIKSDKFDIIFMDPPYNKNLIDEALVSILNKGIIKDDGIIIAEHDIDDAVPDEMGSLRLVRKQKYGDTIMSFYRMDESD